MTTSTPLLALFLLISLHASDSRDVRHLACGPSRCTALHADGSLTTWGKMGALQATWSDTPVAVPGLTGVAGIAVSLELSVALTGDGQVFAWDNTDEKSLPAPVGGIQDVVQVAAGGPTGYALRRDGTVWAWGRVAGISPRLASPGVASVTIPVRVPGVDDAVAIASGFQQGLALTRSGEVFAWGNNAQGSLGDGTTEPRDGAVKVSGIDNAVAVASSGSGNLAVLADGTVRVWGSNLTGALANGNRDGGSTVPVPIKGIAGAVAADGGTGHFVVLMKDGTIRTWGHGGWAETGTGKGGVYTLAPFAPKLPGKAVKVEAGGYNTYVTLEDGRVLGIGLIYSTPWDKYRTHTTEWQTLGPDGFSRPAPAAK